MAPPVEFQFGLAGAACADGPPAARAARRPDARESAARAQQSRFHVAQLRQLDLQPRLDALGVQREDVEDQLGAVEHLQSGGFLDLAGLRRTEFLAEDQQVGVLVVGPAGQFFELARADEVPGLRWRRKISSR